MADRPPGSNDNMQAMNSLNHEKTRANVDTLTDELYVPPIVSLMIVTMAWRSQVCPSLNFLTLILRAGI